jgi:hypothetical protein
MRTRMHNLGNILHKEGRTAEVEKLQRETLDMRRRILGLDNPETLRTAGELAATLFSKHKFEEGQKLYSSRLELVGRTQGMERVGAAWYDYACGAVIGRQRDEAFSLLRQAIAPGDRRGTDGHAGTDAAFDNPRYSRHLHSSSDHGETCCTNRCGLAFRQ